MKTLKGGMDVARGRGADSGGVCRGQAATVRGGGMKRGRAAASLVPAKKRARAPPLEAEQKHDGAAHITESATTRGAKLLGYVRSDQQPVDRKIIWIPNAAVVVTLDSIRRFVEPAQNSSATTFSCVVDAYVRLLQHRGRPSDLIENHKVLILNRSWQAWLEKNTGRSLSLNQHQKLRSLSLNQHQKLRTLSLNQHQKLKDTGNNFLQHDMVFIPFLYNRHWILVVINFDKEEYQVLDSKPRYGYKRVLSKLRRGVEQCIFAAQANRIRKGGDFLDITKWPIRIIKRLPRQTDGRSCGMFMLKYMQLWNGTKLLEKFSQDDIASIKEEIAVDLVFSELNTMNDVQAEIMKWNAVN
ncbi:hypothetical protein ACP70R_022422 [Stipagrostis hirtigluma subsp. patula]